MNSRSGKPKRSAEELVAKLRNEKGITFFNVSEKDAADHLKSHNNYLRTAAYRKNYDKHKTGVNAGKYVQLDFSYLVELSKLDMYLRDLLLPMCIDLEHALKVSLLNDIEANAYEDGYSIVDGFLSIHSDVLAKIASKADSVFTGNLLSNYFEVCYVFNAKDTGCLKTDILHFDCPAWVLVELLSFKDFLDFFRFYSNTYPGRISANYNLLNSVRSLRNACAHNNCILVSLRTRTTHPPKEASRRIAKIPSVAKEERKNKLSCRPLCEIVCLLVEYETWVSPSVKNHRMDALKEFANSRMIKHIDYFSTNQVVGTSIRFLQKVIDNF